MSNTIDTKVFGMLDAHTPVILYMLKNASGMQVSISNFGGAMSSLFCPDRNGVPGDVVLGFDQLQPYLQGSPYIGTLIGRYCNRIAKGCFILDGDTFHLPVNNNGQHLHGGPEGFDKRLWQAEAYAENGESVLILSYTSADGEQGYPGTLQASAKYRLTDANELRIEFHASTDKPTHVNMTQHSYFNLAGEGDILQHELTLAADNYTPVNASLIPLGPQQAVGDTVFDFRKGRAIGARINADDAQLARAQGYDHNFVLNKSTPAAFTKAARVWEPTSGRILEISTTEPGIQFYSGNFLDGSFSGKGRNFSRYSAFCLEPQHFPDSPNQPGYPSTVLRPGELYQSTSVYRFSTDRDDH